MLVPVASRAPYPSQMISRGTITLPPPTPSSPLKIPPAVPIAASLSVGDVTAGVGMAGDTRARDRRERRGPRPRSRPARLADRPPSGAARALRDPHGRRWDDCADRERPVRGGRARGDAPPAPCPGKAVRAGRLPERPPRPGRTAGGWTRRARVLR